MARDRVTVQEAARRLGVKDDAIRKRIQRGSIEHEKGEDGRVYVYLDATHDEAHDAYKDATQYAAHDSGELVEVLRDEVEHLRRQLDEEREARTEERRRHDMLMAQLMQRIPELEAPTPTPEPRGSTESATEDAGGVDTPTASAEPQEDAQHLPWWRRWFG